MNPDHQFDVEFAVKQAERLFIKTGRLASVDYPWDKRPRELPITAFEVSLAMAAANSDLEQAAKLLRVTPARLRRETIEINAGSLDDSDMEGVVWRKRSNAPVVFCAQGDVLTVLIKTRKFKCKTTLEQDEEGNFILTVHPVRQLTPEQEKLAQIAEANLREKSEREAAAKKVS